MPCKKSRVQSCLTVLDLPRPYLLFLGEEADLPYAKTAQGLRDWAPEACVGQFACAGSASSIGLPTLSPKEAYERGARAAVIGVANQGGVMRPMWIVALIEALDSGLHLISGLHGQLANCQPLAAAAKRNGLRLIDIRVPPSGIPIATGRKRAGNRLLTVGTDCALGKKYTALCLTRAILARGFHADFRATGQTGILIAGAGIPIDAVVSDFVAGAAEILSPDAAPDHWDVVEGQGSVFHPAYAGVSLGLLHGSQPDVLVLCHEVGRNRIMGLEEFPTPSLVEAIELTVRLGSRTNASIRCAGISLNTASLDETQAYDVLDRYSRELGLPVADPMRGGRRFDELVSACLAPKPLG
jgi:uncharacterized NAD-dependent epimerase/dehydratase family protein